MLLWTLVTLGFSLPQPYICVAQSEIGTHCAEMPATNGTYTAEEAQAAVDDYCDAFPDVHIATINFNGSLYSVDCWNKAIGWGGEG